jgi:hypothetical protein
MFSVPKTLPAEEHARLKQATRELLDRIDATYARTGEPLRLPIEPEARAVFDEWYTDPAVARSVYSVRLDTYGHRLMVLLALTTATAGELAVTRKVAEAVVGLLRYELEARRETDPGDGDTAVARLEQRIKATLARGGRFKRDLQKTINASRPGIWAWEKATANLKRDGQLSWDSRQHGTRREEYYWLVESEVEVPSVVPSAA